MNSKHIFIPKLQMDSLSPTLADTSNSPKTKDLYKVSLLIYFSKVKLKK